MAPVGLCPFIAFKAVIALRAGSWSRNRKAGILKVRSSHLPRLRSVPLARVYSSQSAAISVLDKVSNWASAAAGLDVRGWQPGDR
jgi:hypothetical protein